MNIKKQILSIAIISCTFIIIVEKNEPLKNFLRNTYYDKIRGTPIINVLPRSEVKCTDISNQNTLVALTLGQSNAANFGIPRFKPDRNVFNLFEGKCFIAEDPMIGASGDGGSVWTRLGQILVETKQYKNAIFITIAEGSSEISQWVSGGIYEKKLLRAIKQAKKSHITITHVLWHQGETDASKGTSQSEYLLNLQRLIDSIRSNGVHAPFFVSVASYCQYKVSSAIQSAQKSSIDFNKRIYPGPNTDLMTSSKYRRDNCHFSEEGLEKFAALWANSINNAQHY